MSWVSEGESLAECLHRAFFIYSSERLFGVRVKPGVNEFCGEWVDIEHFRWNTYADAIQSISRLSCSVKNQLRLPPRSSIGICSENRPEWLYTDFSATFNNQIIVGLHAAWPCEDINVVIRDAELNMIVVSRSFVHHIFQSLQVEPCPSLRVIVVIDNDKASELPLNWPDHIKVVFWKDLLCETNHLHTCSSHTRFGIVQKNETYLKGRIQQLDNNEPTEKAQEIWSEPHTLIYSSGTTGHPKGVVVTKKRWKIDAQAGGVSVVDPRQVCSYMPLAHGADRGVMWQTVFCGGSIGFASTSTSTLLDGEKSSFEMLLEDIQCIRPRFFLGLSHFWNRLYSMFKHDLSIRLRPLCLYLLRKNISNLKQITTINTLAIHSDNFALLEKEVLRLREGAEVRAWLLERMREQMGDQALVKAVTGGAHTSPEVIAFMREMMSEGNDTGVFDAYGTTEFPGISVNGIVSEAIDIKLEDVPQLGYLSTDDPPRGEIVVKTKTREDMTLEYFKREQETNETWKDGWYYTGDIGSLVQKNPDEKFVNIIDRKKNFEEMYVDGRSVWVATAELEANVYQAIEGVHQLMLVADRNAAALVAVIVPEGKHNSNSDQQQAILHINANGHTTNALHAHLLAKLQLVGKGLASYQIPSAIIIENEAWTVENGWLSAVGKLKRGALKLRYKSQLDAIYARLEVEDEQHHGKPSQSLSPDVTKSDAQTEEDDILREDAETALLETIAAVKELVKEEQKQSKRKPQQVHISEFMTKFEFEGNTKADTAKINEIWHKYRDINRVKRDMQEKWIEERQLKEDVEKKQLETLMLTSRKEIRDAISALLSYTSSSSPISSTPSSQQIENDTQVLTLTRKIIDAFQNTKAQVKRAQQKISSIREPIEQARIYHQSNKAFRDLQIVANATNVLIPWQLRGTIEWIWPPQEGREPVGIPIGEAKVWCDVCGILIEETEQDEGKKRLHCLDCVGGSDQCEECYLGLKSVEKFLLEYSVRDRANDSDNSCSDSSRSGNSVAIVRASCKNDIDEREMNDFVLRALHELQLIDRHMFHALSRDVLHICHLQDRTKKYLAEEDTPAGLISSAFVNYADRLALGIPLRYSDIDSSNRSGSSSSRSSSSSSGSSNSGGNSDSETVRLFSTQLPKAADLTLRLHDDFLWLTYEQIGILAKRVATKLIKLDLQNTFVGICGYNSFEWAIADFACMLAGCAVIGFHTTYTETVAQQVFENANVSALFCCRDVLSSSSSGSSSNNSSSDRWTVLELVRKFPSACQALKHVILMEEGEGFANTDQSQMIEKLGVHSMLEWVRPNDDEKDFPLPDPYLQKGVVCDVGNGQTESVVTLLYTSGSSGVPKGVMMSALSFISDIRERSFASPLVTASYIPLSHSSDRMKLWEFMGNGGRVGFVFYDPYNWIEHETVKKQGMIDTKNITGNTNGVVSLFEQISLLKPTALSCPTRIWNGLYAFYNNLLLAAATSSISPSSSTPSPKAGEDLLPDVASMFGPRIKFVATGGSPTSDAVKAFVKKLLPECNFVDSYGTTECGAITANGYVIKNKGIQVKLRDVPEQGFTNSDKPFPRGEIIVSTPNMSPGYFRRPEATAAVFVDGWYRTGDLGRLHPTSGRYDVLERLSAVASLADGTVVFPGALEALYDHLEGWADLVHVHVPVHSAYLVAVVVPSARMLERLRDSRLYCSVLSCAEIRPCAKHFAEQDEEFLLRLLRRTHSVACTECGGISSAHVPQHARFFKADQNFRNLITGSLKLPRQELERLFLPTIQTMLLA